MVTDKNKDIATIQYNHLNLPSKVIKETGDYVKYIYNAAGVKQSQEVYDSSNALKKKTDYLGEFFYENDTLKFVNHEEGRIVMTGPGPEYQYSLKDHLGNTRVTFTTKSNVESFVASLDVTRAEYEQSIFGSYNSFTDQSMDPTPSASENDKILKLNGGYNGQIGLTKSLAVVPGDLIALEVYAKVGESGGTSNLMNFAAALTQAFGLSPSIPGEAATAFEALNSFGLEIANGGRDDDEDEPKGFLNIIVFDQDYNFVTAAFKQVMEADTDTTSLRLRIRQPGYAFVFLSNESEVPQEIGFDTFVVTQHHSDVIQQDDYYPFGLTFNSYQRENSAEQKYLYSGKELQHELDLGWLDFGARMYTPELGMWSVVDPHGENYYGFSPYSFCLGNPVVFTDPDGKDVIFSVTRDKKTGEINGVNVSSTIYVTGAGSTQKRVDELNNASSGVFKDRTINGITVALNITYKYAERIETKDLKAGENVLNFSNKVSEGEDRSHVNGWDKEGTDADGLPVKTIYTGRHGEIYKDDWNNDLTIFHETLHFTGLADRYFEHGKPLGEGNPMPGFEKDIMGTSSNRIGYDHYKAYYDRATDPALLRKFRNGRFLNRAAIDVTRNGKPISPSQKQIDEQNQP